MPINKKNAPSEIFNALQKEAQHHHHEAIEHDDEGNHHHHIPHRVYDVDVFDIAHKGSLSSAQQTAWRFIIRDGHGIPHVAEVGMNETLDEHELHYVNTGRHVDNFMAIAELIHSQEEHFGHEEGKNYEIDLLQAGSVHVLAIWVREIEENENLKSGYFIPLAPVNSLFEAHRKYEYEEFVAILQKAAQGAVNQINAEIRAEIGMDTAAKEQAADDLTRIEGIGAKAATILNEAGYTTFSSVAAAQPAGLEAILKAAGSRYNFLDATTWPEQAALAAEGRWEELDKLQDELKGGRRE